MSKELEAVLRAEIAKDGTISFARFMDLALYCPKIGYYQRREGRIGRKGDYYTSVSVGKLFGELLGWQFGEWLGADGPAVRPYLEQVQLVEAGAHGGQLAADILSWLKANRAELWAELEYWIIERSEERQEWQRKRLEDFAGKVLWFKDFAEVPHDVRGVIFSNELLDAMPLQRFAWDAKEKVRFEWGVGWDETKFVWQRMATEQEAVRASFPELAPELEAVLPDGFVIEISQAAADWWKAAAERLASGKLMTIDYGFRAGELLVPERANGTLRAYRDHQVSDSVLADPGEQDLTAHVNFSQLERVGEAAGLRTEWFGSQATFLMRIVEQRADGDLGAPRELQTLTHPEHLGERFRVLVQARNTESSFAGP